MPEQAHRGRDNNRRWRVRVRKRQTRRQWLVQWHHNTESSGWWSDFFVDADSAEDAARKAGERVDFEEHTRPSDRRLTVHVYGPIPTDFEEFKVAEAMSVEHVPATRVEPVR